ncbi:MAG: diaminopimelate epimerase [Myxococcota bacterium]|nr:diaminopimelate epimerase [Myxococcota bacterium]
MKFSKYHGLGNDFIIVERPDIDTQDVVKLCNRRTGIGADGVLLINPGQSAPYSMRVLNADGSEAEMCGNGLRCAAAYLVDKSLWHDQTLMLETGAGTLQVDMKDGLVSVHMGAVHDHGEKNISLDSQIVTGRFLSTGNPHFVLFGEKHYHDRSKLGPILCTHPAFKSGANISFARLNQDQSIDLVVWERGCGFTQACGTGATATAAAAWVMGRIQVGPTRICLPGGPLTISGKLNGIIMTGPAVRVYDGHADCLQ